MTVRALLKLMCGCICWETKRFQIAMSLRCVHTTMKLTMMHTLQHRTKCFCTNNSHCS